jgi:hypothetical protein
MAIESLHFFEQGTDAPSEWEFWNWASVLRSEFADLREEQSEEEAIYFQAFDVFVPQTTLPNPVQPIKTGSAPADANAAIDSLVPPKIIIKVRPARNRKKYKDQATKLALAGTALLDSWRKREDVLKLLAADMVIHRVGVGRVLYDPSLFPPFNAPDQDEQESDEDHSARVEDAREDFTIRKRKRCPIIFERRDPKAVSWRMHNGEILVMAEEFQTTALEALQTFRGFPAAKKYLDQYRENPAYKCTVKDVWYGKYRCMYLDDIPIFRRASVDDRTLGLTDDGVVEHGYPLIPYIVVAFRELPFVEPNFRYRGMLTEAKGLYPAESNVLTMNIAILGWNAWRTWKGWTHDTKPIEVVPGQYIPLDPRKGEYLEMLEGTAVPPEVMEMAATLDTYIQRNGVAQGPRTAEGTRSGQQLWAIQAMRAMKIENAKMGLAAAVGIALGYAVMEIEENVKEKIVLPIDAKDKDGQDMGEVSISPSDIDGYWEGFKAVFVLRQDPATIEQGKGLAALWAQNFMPWEAAVEMAGMTDNPAEWEAAIFREKAERSAIMVDLMTLERIRAFYDPDYDPDGPEAAAFGKQLVERLQQKIMQEGSLNGGGKGGPGGGPGGGAQGGQASPPGMKGPGTAGSDLAQALQSRRPPSGGRGQPSRGGGGRQGQSYGG